MPAKERTHIPPAKPEGLRERKKRETRQLISDLATRLFAERGFENVTVDEVAAAASVSKMTVFNYFPRKEDLFFDRNGEVQVRLRDALEGRGARSPLAALRSLADELLERREDSAQRSAGIARFWETVAASPALRARIREMAEELERDLSQMLAASVGAPVDDPLARLLAALLLGAWRVAYREALLHHRTARVSSHRDVVLELLDRGFAAARVAARGTPYA